MVNDNGLIKKFGATNPLIDLVFLHGLTGDPVETWSSESNGEFWPEWLADDLGDVDVYTIGYPASIFAQWANKEMDLFERAGNILEHMAGSNLGSRPIVFVTHSLGGILAKQILRRAIDSTDGDHKRIAESTKLVIFLATPHTGASLASALALLPGTSSHIKLLSNGSGFLDDLNQHYRNFANQRSDLQTVAYYEKFKTAKMAEVVDRHSADPGVANTQPVAVDKDHINICKPSDREDVVYLGVKRHIRNLCASLIAAMPRNDDYSVRSTSDRRDLLNKLIDANREHEYSFANNAQNKFAQKLAKTGLFTTARDDHDLLLTEVESRFVLHIYHPLICKGASDQAITQTLQAQVIDPLAYKKMGGTAFTPKEVLCALYYLTEQCHVRWDPEK